MLTKSPGAVDVTDRSLPRSHRRMRAWALIRTTTLTLVVGGIALLPRTTGLADFYTIDEAYHWMLRVRLFSQALADRNWAGTNLTGHLGVTAMWLGALGRWWALKSGINEPGFADGTAYLALLRLPSAIVTSLAVVVGYLLLRRLLRTETALLASLLWATAPFLIAHSRLLHLDALVTSFMTLTLLFVLVALRDSGATLPRTDDSTAARQPRLRLGALMAGGVCGGLALRTKSPALVLLPAVGLMLFGVPEYGSFRARLRWSLGWYGVWLGVVAVVFVVGWPAMWVASRTAIEQVIAEVIVNGGQPHDGGNYFFRQQVADPGWLFYPVVLLFRSTPLMLLGLLLLPFAVKARNERRVLLALLGFALLFGAAMSLGAKKLDRYVLPIWPTLAVLAAAGLITLARWIYGWLQHWTWARELRRYTPVRLLALAVLCAALLVADRQYHPYYLAYFNPLLGGGAVAQRVLLVGWGEGLEQVGAWLSRRPDIGSGPVLSWIPPTLVHFVPQQVRDLDMTTVRQPSSYAVLYVRNSQKQDAPEAESYVRQSPPLFTVKLYGIEYASVYQLPKPGSGTIWTEL